VDDYVLGAAFDPAGTRLAAACRHRGVLLWDVASRELRGVFAPDRGSRECWMPVFGGPWMAAKNDSGVAIWNIPSWSAPLGTEESTKPSVSVAIGDGDHITAIALSPDGRLLAVARPPSNVTLFAVPEARELFTMQFRGGTLGDAVTTRTPDGETEIPDEASEILALSRCTLDGKAVPFELCDDLWLRRHLWARQIRTLPLIHTTPKVQLPEAPLPSAR
jgi:hypothetical protein